MTPERTPHRSWILVGALALAALLQPLACTPGEAIDPVLDAHYGRALQQVGPGVITPALLRAQTAAVTLAEACAAWEADSTDADAREVARAAWRDMMAAWQPLEVMQVGPLGSALSAVGGQGLRDRVLSWPTSSACRVDQETVAGDFASPGFFDGALVNVEGLDALEVLLFAPDATHACGADDALQTSGAWTALGPAGVAAARASYAAVLAAEVERVVTVAVDTWSPTGGDFGAALEVSPAAGSPFDTRQEALNAVFDALFYLEKSTKDRKLGRPLGLLECDAATCPEAVESPLAGGSLDWIVANLDGFQALFTGGDGEGMDDVLIFLGHAEVVDDVLAAVEAARLAADDVDGELAQAVDADADDALALHAAIKAVTDVLKTEVAPLLMLQIPSEAAGDND